jgi:preprotein translocase subunit SecG
LHTLLTVVHIFACIAMILVVLLQTGKGADMGAAFGGSSQTIFGSSGPGTFLGKMTTGIAIVFMLTSLSLAYMAFHKPVSVLEDTAVPVTEQTTSADQNKVPAQTGTDRAETK